MKNNWINKHEEHIENKLCYKVLIEKEPPKQETTLEEAIERTKGEYPVWLDEEAFILGAKWQQERSYSKEEVLQLLIKFYQFNNFNGTIEEWLEQFKNK